MADGALSNERILSEYKQLIDQLQDDIIQQETQYRVVGLNVFGRIPAALDENVDTTNHPLMRAQFGLFGRTALPPIIAQMHQCRTLREDALALWHMARSFQHRPVTMHGLLDQAKDCLHETLDSLTAIRDDVIFLGANLVDWITLAHTGGHSSQDTERSRALSAWVRLLPEVQSMMEQLNWTADAAIESILTSQEAQSILWPAPPPSNSSFDDDDDDENVSPPSPARSRRRNGIAGLPGSLRRSSTIRRPLTDSRPVSPEQDEHPTVPNDTRATDEAALRDRRELLSRQGVAPEPTYDDPNPHPGLPGPSWGFR